MARYALAPIPLILGTLLACRCGDDDKAKDAAPSAKPSASAAVPAEAECDPAYFGVDGVGVVELCDGKLEKVVDLPRVFKDIEVSPSGSIWVCAVGGVWKIDDDEPTQVDQSQRDAIFVVADNDVWAISFDGIAHFAGSSWSLEDKALLGEDIKELKDIAVDAAGTVWVLSTNAMHQKPRGGEWRRLELSTMVAERPFYRRFAMGPNDALFASWASGLIVRKKDGWHKVDLGSGTLAIDYVAAGEQQGTAAVSGPAEAYLSVPGKPAQKITPGANGFKASQLRGVQLDGKARLWLATDFGMVVLKDGKLIQQWLPGSLPEIAGNITHFVVLGNGPDLPKPGKVAKGTIKGKVVQDEKPIAEATVELCPTPIMAANAPPCLGAPFKVTTKTDAEGAFTLADVPTGSFGFAVQAGKDWALPRGGSCCEKLKAGKTLDVGTLTVPAKKKGRKR